MAPEQQDSPGGLMRRDPAASSLSRQGSDQLSLHRLERDEYIPSVQPWVRHSATVMLAGAGLGMLLLSVLPYRVVVRATGAVRPAGELVLINAPFDGRVVSIDVRANQRVRAGQGIVRLDPSQGQGEVLQYQTSENALTRQREAMQGQATAELASAELEVDKVRSSLQLAETEFQRFSGLAASGSVPRLMFDEKQATLRQQQASLAQAVKRLDEIRARARTSVAALERDRAGVSAGLDQARRQLTNSVVRSPVAGVVFKVAVRNPLQTVSAGEELASVAPTEAELVVKASVRGEDVDNVMPGQRADLRLQGCPYPDYGTLPAVVVAIAPDALPAREDTEGFDSAGTTLYEVTLRPEKKALQAAARRCEVRIGMALIADITTRQETLLRFVLRKTRILLGN
jgi:multidrug efflux pump subunit AcrA (membrane-fusion protein)